MASDELAVAASLVTNRESFMRRVNGSSVNIRAIGADDASMLQAFVRHLSPQSRRFRFFSGIAELSAGMLERLVKQDYRRGLALVALSEQSGDTVVIAEARCALNQAEGNAEFAIAVADEFQRRGLGVRLLNSLVVFAAKRGIRHLFGEILAENHAMLALAKRLGFKIKTNELDRRTVIASIAPSL